MQDVPHSESRITELRRIITQFGETETAEPDAQALATAKLSTVAEHFTKKRAAALSPASIELRSILDAMNELLIPYKNNPEVADNLHGPTSKLCYTLQALRDRGKHPYPQDYVSTAFAMNAFLQAMKTEYPQPISTERDATDISIEKTADFIRRTSMLEPEGAIGGARYVMGQALRGKTNVFSLGEHSLPVTDDTLRYIERANTAFGMAEKYFNAALAEFAETATSGDGRLLEAVKALPKRGLEEYVRPNSTEATIGNMLLDMKAAAQTLNSMSNARGTKQLYQRFENAVEATIKPESGLYL